MATIAADLVPRSRLGEGMGFYAVTMGLPLGIAPAVGLWLAGRGQFSALFWLAATVTAVSLVPAIVVRVPRLAVVRTVGARARIFSMFERTVVFPSGLMFLLISSFGVIPALLGLFARERGMGSVGPGSRFMLSCGPSPSEGAARDCRRGWLGARRHGRRARPCTPPPQPHPRLYVFFTPLCDSPLRGACVSVRKEADRP